MTAGMIRVQDLSKSFGSVRAVSGISFEVARGEIVGFLGPNGAGKSTTMRVLTTYLPKDSGRVWLAGHDLECRPMAIRRCVGYLPESAPLYDEMRVADHLRFVGRLRGMSPGERRRRLPEMVGVCGLEEVVGRRIGTLSKGYRQRVGLAQTLLHDPEILILDEPTSGLDPNQIVEIREVIRAIGADKTVVLSTHILPEVQATCDRVIIINQGRLVADERIECLMRSTPEGQGEDYLIEIRGDLDRAAGALEAAAGIERVVRLEGDGTRGRLRVIGGTGEVGQLGETIFKVAAREGLVLSEMRRESQSLESVFKRLTVGGEDA